mgnify:CR=1 FL=1
MSWSWETCSPTHTKMTWKASTSWSLGWRRWHWKSPNDDPNYDVWFEHLSDLDVDGGVEADSRHHRTHEFQEDHECLVRFYLLTVLLGLLHEVFHDVAMLTRVHCDHTAVYPKLVRYRGKGGFIPWLSHSDTMRWCPRRLLCCSAVGHAYRCPTAIALECGSSHRK